MDESAKRPDDLAVRARAEKYAKILSKTIISPDGDSNNHGQNWAAMDSLPDLFVGDFRNSAEYSSWVKQGLLHAIPDDLSAYPHLEEYMAGLGKENVPGEDGVLYCIPRQTYPSQAWTCLDRMIVYRWDLAQQAGITREPETWEEFQKMILAIIQADPEGTGIQGMTLWNRAIVSGMLLPYASPLAVSGRWKLDTDGLYKPAYFADDMTSAFQLGRDMYRSGVIERDALLETNSSAYEKFLRGENAALLDSGGYSSNYRELAAYWKNRQIHFKVRMELWKVIVTADGRRGPSVSNLWIILCLRRRCCIIRPGPPVRTS